MKELIELREDVQLCWELQIINMWQFAQALAELERLEEQLTTQEERNALLRKSADEAFAKSEGAPARLDKALEEYRNAP